MFELDIEDVGVLATVMRECGADGAGFAAFVAADGRRQLLDIQREAAAAGVFGVTSFLLDDGDLYWGREHCLASKRCCWLGNQVQAGQTDDAIRSFNSRWCATGSLP